MTFLLIRAPLTLSLIFQDLLASNLSTWPTILKKHFTRRSIFFTRASGRYEGFKTLKPQHPTLHWPYGGATNIISAVCSLASFGYGIRIMPGNRITRLVRYDLIDSLNLSNFWSLGSRSELKDGYSYGCRWRFRINNVPPQLRLLQGVGRLRHTLSPKNGLLSDQAPDLY